MKQIMDEQQLNPGVRIEDHPSKPNFKASVKKIKYRSGGNLKVNRSLDETGHLCHDLLKYHEVPHILSNVIQTHIRQGNRQYTLMTHQNLNGR